MKDPKEKFNYFTSLLNDSGLEINHLEMFTIRGEAELSLGISESKVKVFSRSLNTEFKRLQAIFDHGCPLFSIYLQRSYTASLEPRFNINTDYLFHHLAAIGNFEIDGMYLKYKGERIYQTVFSPAGVGIAYEEYYLEPPLFFGEDTVDFCELWVRKYILKEDTE